MTVRQSCELPRVCAGAGICWETPSVLWRCSERKVCSPEPPLCVPQLLALEAAQIRARQRVPVAFPLCEEAWLLWPLPTLLGCCSLGPERRVSFGRSADGLCQSSPWWGLLRCAGFPSSGEGCASPSEALVCRAAVWPLLFYQELSQSHRGLFDQPVAIGTT